MSEQRVFDVDKIRELVQLMIDHELTEVELREGESCVVIKRGPTGPAITMATVPQAAAQPGAPSVECGAAESPTETGHQEDECVTRTSPMVGTYYAAPDPESPPFVQVGSSVEPDSVICVIEAMKVFNEIKAELAGVVEQVLVRNEEAVEFGQPLVRIRPRG